MTVIEFTARARDELQAAADHYEDERPGLGEAFWEAARAVTERIAANPLAYRKVLGEVRRANFPRRWPWWLAYVVRPNRSVVIGALHGRMDIRRVHGRTPP